MLRIVASGEQSQPGKVVNAKAGPAVKHVPPLHGDRGGSPAGTEQSARDSRDGVGVVAGAHLVRLVGSVVRQRHMMLSAAGLSRMIRA